ncbi:uncharacterized protein LOC121823988 isoform X1 [Peromyscus maniculatus bairdii]|uniref:uncharacterized protein LOC121823988 isoform X1 n=1 Tax=Peromyscus maniculatus bairdii TaxID=230844 RepID=UPI003FD26836
MLVFSRVTYITLSFLLFSESFFIISAFFRTHSMCRNFVPYMTCPKENNPVCGSNGHTYTGRCMFCKAYKWISNMGDDSEKMCFRSSLNSLQAADLYKKSPFCSLTVSSQVDIRPNGFLYSDQVYLINHVGA